MGWSETLGLGRKASFGGVVGDTFGGRRHEETRTPDLYRVNFEVLNLKPFSSLAFPILPKAQTPLKQPSFGDELVTSSRVPLHSLSSQ